MSSYDTSQGHEESAGPLTHLHSIRHQLCDSAQLSQFWVNGGQIATCLHVMLDVCSSSMHSLVYFSSNRLAGNSEHCLAHVRCKPVSRQLLVSNEAHVSESRFPMTKHALTNQPICP